MQRDTAHVSLCAAVSGPGTVRPGLVLSISTGQRGSASASLDPSSAQGSVQGCTPRRNHLCIRGSERSYWAPSCPPPPAASDFRDASSLTFFFFSTARAKECSKTFSNRYFLSDLIYRVLRLFHICPCFLASWQACLSYFIFMIFFFLCTWPRGVHEVAAQQQMGSFPFSFSPSTPSGGAGWGSQH